MKVVLPTSKLVLNYFALPNGLGGRGGVLRFFFLSQGIEFEEKLFAPGEEWAAEKARLKASGENPTAKTPVVYADDQPLPEHISTARLLAHVHGVSSSDHYKNYVQDLVSDEYQNFRNVWAQAVFSGTDDEKATYRETEVPQRLEQFDSLYKSFKCDNSNAFLSTSDKTGQPLWGDAAIFCLLYDHIQAGLLSRQALDKYNHLESMFVAYEKIPAVEQWISSKK